MINENHYKEKQKERQETLELIKKQSTFLLFGKIITFLGGATLCYIYFFRGHNIPFLIIAAISLFCYYLLLKKDATKQHKIRLLQGEIKLLENEISYLNNNLTPFDNGEEFTDDTHPFSNDLDLFGDASLFHRINRTVTFQGKLILAKWLQHEEQDITQIRLKQEAINTLAADESWRIHFLASANNKLNDAFILNQFFKDTNSNSYSKKKLIVLRAYISLFIAFGILSIFIPSLFNIWGLFFILNLFIASFKAKTLSQLSQTIASIKNQTNSFIPLIQEIESSNTESEILHKIKENLSDTQALHAFSKLDKIENALDQRGNLIAFLVLNGLFLKDIKLIYDYQTWEKLYLKSIPEWIEAIGTVDALISLATHTFNHPERNQATWITQDEVHLEAEDIYHPFISQPEAVGNDIKISNGNFYIITGGNMSGKSTFLRTIGINYIMVNNGLPVCARNFKISPLHLFTSMRTSDNITKSASFFQAEINRLEALFNVCKEESNTLFLLDEILKGTNATDKLQGSRLVLEHLSKFPCAGLIATHDLKLTELESQYPQKYKTACFEVYPDPKQADKLNYPYKMTPGVAKNMNATFLINSLLHEAKAPTK